MAKSKAKKKQAEEPTVLDWFKSVLRGQPIPISGKETIEVVEPPRKAPRKVKAAEPKVPVKRVRKPAKETKVLAVDRGKVEVSPRQWLSDFPQETQAWINSLFQTARKHPWRSAAFILAWVLTTIELIRLPVLEPKDNYSSMVVTWVLAFVLFVGAVTPIHQFRSIVRKLSWRRPIWFGGLLVLLTLLAVGLRVWNIGSIPFTLAGDEASQGLEAMRVINGESRNPFTTGWFGVPTMSFFFNSTTIRLLGPTIAALRIPWALIGSATVLLVIFIVTRLYGPRFGVAVGLLLATYHYHIHFSRLGSNQVADAFFMALSVLFLLRAIRERLTIDWVGVGTACAFALYSYAGARIVPLIVSSIIGYLLLHGRRKFWLEHRKGIVVALGTFLIVSAPILQYAFRFPDDFNSRINQVGIIQSGWLEREVDIRGQSSLQILLDQFVRAALAFNFYPDRTVWYGLPQPLLDPIFGSLFLLGLGYGTIRILLPGADKRLVPMLAWWWGPMILGGVFTESPPSSMRLTTLAIPVCFFIALAIWRLILLARKAFSDLPSTAILAASVIFFGFISLRIYFVEFTPQRIYGGSHAELATEMAPILHDLKDSSHFYFFGPPHMYWSFATIPYLVPGAEGEDIIDPITSPPTSDFLTSDKDAVFIFLPIRINELELVVEAFPNGERMEFSKPLTGTKLGTLYRVRKPEGGWGVIGSTSSD